MLSRIVMKLTPSGELSYNMSSLFHGALMERLDSDYADYLHKSQLHPFSQHIEKRNGEWLWIINALNKEADEKIIKNVCVSLDSVYLKRQDIRTVLSTDKPNTRYS